MPWEETENEIRHPVRSSSDFQADSFRRITLKKDVPRVYGVIGKLKGKTTTTLQSLRFPKTPPDNWTLAKAKEWYKQHYKTAAEGVKTMRSEPAIIKLPAQRIEAEFLATSPKREDRTAEVRFYSGATVKRFNWANGEHNLTFSMEPGHCRMGRMNSGHAPLLNAHADHKVSDVIGVCEKAWLEDGQGRARVRFSERAEVDPIWQDVQNRILRNVSMGVVMHKLKETTEEGDKIKSFLAVDWEPLEISIVPIGADPKAAFLAAENETDCEMELALGAPHEQPTLEAGTERADARKEAHMEQETMIDAGAQARAVTDAATAATEAERNRVKELTEIGNRHNLAAAFTAEHVGKGTSVEDFRKLALNVLADRSDALNPQRGHVVFMRDGDQTRHDSIVAALLHRYDPSAFPLKDGVGREWFGYSLCEIARQHLDAHGVSTRGKSKLDIAQLALTTADFPFILADAAGKTLRQAYEASPRTFVPWCRQRTAADFKNIKAIQLGEAPALLLVTEANPQFQQGVMAESREQYALATYGRVVSITRQTLVNDDLNAFTRVPAALGTQAAVLENNTVWDIITTNAAMADAVALFHADHSNLVTGAGSALGLAGLAAGFAAMAKQKGLDATTVLNLQPKFILVPVALQLTAFQLFAANIVPLEAGKVVPEYLRAITPIAEPRLDATSAAYWYLAASPAQIDTIEYAYLEGQQGVYLETRQGFEVDGIEIKARLDFAAKAIDWRGLQRNNGA